MKSIYCIPLIIFCLFCSSCFRADKELIYSVSDFSVPISCISPSGNDSIFYIGFENGSIIQTNVVSNSRTVIRAGNNRIYTVCAENDSTLWVGIRNEGVKRIVNGAVRKKYFIPNPLDTKKVTSSFAAYTIQADKDSLYFATSSGLYTLDKNKWAENSALHLCYRPDGYSNYHFGINQVFVNNAGIYAATSDSGLLVLDRHNPKITKKLTSEEVLHLYKHSDSLLYATSSRSIYQINPQQPMELQKAVPIKTSDHYIFAYMADAPNNRQQQWTLTATAMKYRDENGDASLQLPDKLSNSYKNYVCKGQDFIMVACRNKLYTFSLHQNPKGESNNVIAACNGKNGLCYFITLDNKLYAVGKDENRAKPVGKLTLAIGEKPVKFHAGEKYLWLITNNSLYKINPDNAETSYEIGIKGSDAKKKISEKKIDFRSIREDNGQLFLGTRNCLLRVKLDTPEKIDIIPTARNTNADCSDLYITDISENNCFASMRHGIFVLNEKDSLDKISGSDSIGDIRRFIRRNDDYSYLYTSKGVYEWKHDGFKKKDNIHPEFVSTVYDRESGFFIVGYKGIIAAGTKDDFIRSINRNLGISANEAAIAEAADRKTLFVGTQTGLYKLGENNSLTLIEIPPKNYTVLYFTLLAIGLIIVVFMTVFHYFHQKRLIKNKLKRYGEKIAEHIKKEKSKELNLRKEELENSLKTVNIAGIGKLNKEIKAFEARIEEVLIKRKEIIGSLKTIIDSKIKEIGRITVDDDDSKHEWNEILKAADKTENEDNNEYSIDYSFALYRRISKYEKNYIKKTAVTQRMSVRQKKDFGELHKIFIVREERKEGENEQEKKARQTREETIRNRIKSKCEELLEKYREDLDDLKLKSNTKKSYVSLLLISGKFDNADIEKTMKFSRVGDDRYKLHEELKQKTGRNALLEQLYQHTKPQK